ncbi:hypothetical protein chiPu_0027548, partial [Chiloscyllium punctatum]|nr:hypothetical protein [Chiloscyllium punctatum]
RQGGGRASETGRWASERARQGGERASETGRWASERDRAVGGRASETGRWARQGGGRAGERDRAVGGRASETGRWAGGRARQGGGRAGERDRAVGERDRAVGERDRAEISFHFLEPFRTEDCDTYPSCLACLADQGCGWCPDTSTCHQRVLGIDGQCGRSRHLILTPGGCVLCSEHTDCPSCSRDPYCEWQVNVNRKGDFQCTRRGRSPRAIHSPAACPGPCHL